MSAPRARVKVEQVEMTLAGGDVERALVVEPRWLTSAPASMSRLAVGTSPAHAATSSWSSNEPGAEVAARLLGVLGDGTRQPHS